MATKSAPRRSSPYAIAPKAGGASVKASASKPAKPVIGGVRKGHDRGKKQPPEVVQATHAEWKARMKQDRVAHMGIGKKATHSKVPVARRLEFER